MIPKYSSSTDVVLPKFTIIDHFLVSRDVWTPWKNKKILYKSCINHKHTALWEQWEPCKQGKECERESLQRPSSIIIQWHTSLHLLELYMARDLRITLHDPLGLRTEAPSKQGLTSHLSPLSLSLLLLFVQYVVQISPCCRRIGISAANCAQPQLTLWSSLRCHRVQAWQIQ